MSQLVSRTEAVRLVSIGEGDGKSLYQDSPKHVRDWLDIFSNVNAKKRFLELDAGGQAEVCKSLFSMLSVISGL